MALLIAANEADLALTKPRRFSLRARAESRRCFFKTAEAQRFWNKDRQSRQTRLAISSSRLGGSSAAPLRGGRSASNYNCSGQGNYKCSRRSPMQDVPRISEAEWEVLGVLLRSSPLTASQVFAELGERAWKLNTVRTFLTRLEKKGGDRGDGRHGGKSVLAPDRAVRVCARGQPKLSRSCFRGGRRVAAHPFRQK